MWICVAFREMARLRRSKSDFVERQKIIFQADGPASRNVPPTSRPDLSKVNVTVAMIA
jgi:hypothetical protein